MALHRDEAKRRCNDRGHLAGRSLDQRDERPFFFYDIFGEFRAVVLRNESLLFSSRSTRHIVVGIRLLRWDELYFSGTQVTSLDGVFLE